MGDHCTPPKRVRLVVGNDGHSQQDGGKLFVVDAHRSDSERRFIVRSDKIIAAFLELEQVTRSEIPPA